MQESGVIWIFFLRFACELSKGQYIQSTECFLFFSFLNSPQGALSIMAWSLWNWIGRQFFFFMSLCVKLPWPVALVTRGSSVRPPSPGALRNSWGFSAVIAGGGQGEPLAFHFQRCCSAPLQHTQGSPPPPPRRNCQQCWGWEILG